MRPLARDVDDLAGLEERLGRDGHRLLRKLVGIVALEEVRPHVVADLEELAVRRVVEREGLFSLEHPEPRVRLPDVDVQLGLGACGPEKQPAEGRSQVLGQAQEGVGRVEEWRRGEVLHKVGYVVGEVPGAQVRYGLVLAQLRGPRAVRRRSQRAACARRARGRPQRAGQGRMRDGRRRGRGVRAHQHRSSGGAHAHAHTHTLAYSSNFARYSPSEMYSLTPAVSMPVPGFTWPYVCANQSMDHLRPPSRKAGQASIAPVTTTGIPLPAPLSPVNAVTAHRARGARRGTLGTS